MEFDDLAWLVNAITLIPSNISKTCDLMKEEEAENLYYSKLGI